MEEQFIEQTFAELKISSRVSLIMALIGAALLLASVTYSITRLSPLEREIAAKQETAKSLRSEIAALTEQRNLLRADVDKAQPLLAQVSNLSDAPEPIKADANATQQQLASTKQTVDAQATGTAPKNSGNVEGAQFETLVSETDPSLTEKAKKYEQALTDAKAVFVTLRQVKHTPDLTEVRYFHYPDDKLLAEAMLVLLKKAGLPSGRTSYVLDRNNPPAPRYIQISFASTALQ